MKSLQIYLLFVALAILCVYSCKKDEPIGDQQFVENFLVGKWPFKAAVSQEYKNGVLLKNDTILYGIDTLTIVDTVIFTKDQYLIRANKDSVKFSIDSRGDSIRFSKNTMGKWLIRTLTPQSIELVQDKTEKNGNDTYRYYKEELYRRN